ncbi:MAG: hypothetical protein ACPGRC_09670 [Salibacteraceae bacterium]
MRKFLPFLIIAFFGNSCKTSVETNGLVQLSTIQSINCTEKTTVGNSIPVTVNFWGPDGCSTAYSIKAEKIGQTITLRAYYLHQEEACTQATVNLTLDYVYYADLPGSYFFISEGDNNISDTLVVL